uniref:Uncharacterized protein n=1 Tax=Anguilla anguilla TaxID=7936 RepID=A0A0E9PEX2_ANGAN
MCQRQWAKAACLVIDKAGCNERACSGGRLVALGCRNSPGVVM